ncbi:MAG: hypothetical protein ACRC10_05860 [Thermoguttaceae bacterium]
MTYQTSSTSIDEILKLCYHTTKDSNVPVYPYVTAVTGHRTFVQSNVRETFQTLLTSLAKCWLKDSGGYAPLILLTGMADGVDMIAAEVALELQKKFNIAIIAVLPMEKSVYLKTITDKERFEKILSQTTIIPMPLHAKNIGETAHTELVDADNPQTEWRRALQYEMVANFLAVHSHTLFAIWDGIDQSEKIGGTSTVVRFKLEANPKSFETENSNSLTFPTVGPVVQIFVTRDDAAHKRNILPEWLTIENSPSQSPPVFLWERDNLPPKERGELTKDMQFTIPNNLGYHKAVTSAIVRLGLVNRDMVENYAHISQDKQECSKTDMGITPSARNSIQFDAETDILLDYYAVIDQLAIYFQNRTVKTITGYVFLLFMLLLTSGTLASFWVVRQNGWGNTPESWFRFLWIAGSESAFDSMFLLSVIYWGVFSALLGLYCFAKFEQFHHRYHRYRTVAEALRVQIFWRIAGMRDCVSGYYRSHQMDDLVWLRCALNGLDVLLDTPADMSPTELEKRIVFTQCKWIVDKDSGQLSYFRRTIPKRERPWKHEKAPWSAKKLFAILSYIATHKWMKGVLFLLLSLFLLAQPVADNINAWIFHGLGDRDIGLWIVVAFGMTLTICSSLFVSGILYIQLMRYAQEANRYKLMICPHDTANKLLTKLLESTPVNITMCQDVLRDLGTEALSENAEWLLAVGERKLVLPR